MRECCYTHFTDEERDSGSLSNFPRVTCLINSGQCLNSSLFEAKLIAQLFPISGSLSRLAVISLNQVLTVH